jgi:aspartokinase
LFSNKKADENSKIWWKSLANGEGINTVLDIIEDKINKRKIAVVVSAGKATDELDDILTIAAKTNYKLY